jgi:hypothetical protein
MAATDTKPRGGKPDKLVRDALLAAIRQEPDKLKRIAEKWLDKAEEGDQAAINALADRIDGKAVQALVGDEDYAPIKLDVTLPPDEAYRRMLNG